MKRNFRRRLSISTCTIMVFLLLVNMIVPMKIHAETQQVAIDFEIQKAYDVDVVLAVDGSTQNIDTYKSDLENALTERGIKASNLNIQTIETNTTNILEGKFELNLYWPKGSTDIDMDSHIEFWSDSKKIDELSYRKLTVYGSSLNHDDRVGGTGEIITLSLASDNVPENIVEMRVLINPFGGSANSTMYLRKEVNGEKKVVIQTTAFVATEKYYFGSFMRNGDSWDFHFNNGSIFSGREVEVISKDFLEVLREPDWRQSSKKFIVNLNDETVEDFENSIALGEIIARMDNDQIHYIGWGEDKDNEGEIDLTQNQAESFIRKNNGFGTFVNRSNATTYLQQINQTADYIADQLSNEATSDYLVLGNNYEFSINPSSELVNTIDEDWPEGKWKIVHDPSIYESNQGTASFSGAYTDSPFLIFNKVGKYDIYYADELIKTLYVHHAPTSEFTFEKINNEIKLINSSKDKDLLSSSNGIKSSQWKWKKSTDESWNVGEPTEFLPNEDYIIQLMVEDFQNTWSESRSIYYSTRNEQIAPIADFTLENNQLILPDNQLVINTLSYDPRILDLQLEEWEVFKDGISIYKGSVPKTNYTLDGVGAYKITKKVKNTDNSWSAPFSRFFTISENKSPELSVFGNLVMDKDKLKEVNFNVFDIETDITDLTVRVTSSNQDVIPSSAISFKGHGTNRTLVIDPIGVEGSSTITVILSDGNISVNQSFKVDVKNFTEPIIQSIQIKNIKEYYKAGDVLLFEVTFDQVVTVNGEPILNLTFGESLQRSAEYLGGSETKKIQFIYIIQPGDDTNQIKIVKENAINLFNGSEIMNQVEIKAKVELMEDYIWQTSTIDTIAPFKPIIASQEKKPGAGMVEILSGAPIVGEIAWLAPQGTTRFSESTTMTKLVGNGENKFIAAPLAEGTYYLFLVDRSGNRSESSNEFLTIDGTSPGLPIIAEPIALDNQINLAESTNLLIMGTSEANINLEIIITDSEGKEIILQTTTDENGNWMVSEIKVSELKDGNLLLTVKAIDLAGNESGEQTKNLYKKTTIPNNQNELIGNNYYLNSNQYLPLDTIAGEGIFVYLAPSGTSHESMIANSETITSVNGNYSEISLPSTSGIYRIYLVDNVGNISDESDYFVIVDDLLPTIHSVTTNETSWTNQSVTFIVTAEDNGLSGIKEIKFDYGIKDNNHFISNGIQINSDQFLINQNGTYTIFVSDQVGNATTKVIEVSNIDKEKPNKPQINVNPNRDFYNQGLLVTIQQGLDDLSGSKFTEYRILEMSDDWIIYSDNIEFEEDGVYTIEVRTWDNAGNSSLIESRTLIINSETSVFPIILVVPDVEISKEDVLVTLTMNDQSEHEVEANQAELYYQLPQTNEFVLYTEPFTIGEGITTILVKVVDRYGNETFIDKTVAVDKTAPTNQDQLLTNSIYAKGNKFVDINASLEKEDTIWLAPIGTTNFEISETITKALGDATRILTPTTEGIYVLYVMDLAGNISNGSVQHIIVDNTAPIIEGIVQAEISKTYPTITFNEGIAMLNGQSFTSGNTIEANGEYELIVVDEAGNNTIVEFVVDNDEESVKKDFEALRIDYFAGDSRDWVSNNLQLLKNGLYGSTISWESNFPEILTNDGIVTAPVVDTEIILSVIVEKGEYKLETQFSVKVIADPIKPTITLKGSNHVYIEQGKVYIEAGAEAFDNIDGIISNNIEITNYIDTTKLGEYKLIYRVRDNAGNVAEIERVVTVTAPVIAGSLIVPVNDNQEATNNRIKEAIDEANRQGKNKIILEITEPTETSASKNVSIEREHLRTANNQDLKIEFKTDNASIHLPTKSLDLSNFPTNSRLELSIEKVDLTKPTNQLLVSAVDKINNQLTIYEGKVFDFTMNKIELELDGTVKSKEIIKNFQSEEDITLTINIGNDLNESYFMTFYYNESLSEWEYIRSSYENISGNMVLQTNHLSIYSVMNSTKEIKQEELAKFLNKNGISVQEARTIIEDIDMDFDAVAMEKYQSLPTNHKNTVVQSILLNKPLTGYTYSTLQPEVTASINELLDELSNDSTKPIITLKGNSSMKIVNGNSFVEPGVTAVDNKDGDISGRIISTGTVDTSRNGTYLLTYTITDFNGNKSEITRKVVVYTPSIENNSLIKIDNTNDYKVIKSYDLFPSVTQKNIEIIGDVYEIQLTDYKSNNGTNVQFQFNPDDIQNMNQLSIFKYDYELKKWIALPSEINLTNNTITTKLLSVETVALIENSVYFHDMKGHWASDIVDYLAAREIILGDNNGKFNPNIGITRAEFTTLIVRLMQLETKGIKTEFKDISNKWYESAVTIGFEHQIVKGVSDTSFEPERIVTRQEMAAIVVRALKLTSDVELTKEEVSGMNLYLDNDTIGNWAYLDVYTAQKYGLLIGRSKDKFVPNSPTLRGEAATAIYNLLQVLE